MSNTHNGIYLSNASGTLDEYGNNAGSGGGGTTFNTNFVGTRQEWEALSQEEQNAYDTVDIVGEDGISWSSYQLTSSTTYSDITALVKSATDNNKIPFVRIERASNQGYLILPLSVHYSNESTIAFSTFYNDYYTNNITTLLRTLTVNSSETVYTERNLQDSYNHAGTIDMSGVSSFTMYY